MFEWIAESIVNWLNLTGNLGKAVEFWIYDSLKISTIVIIVVLGIGYLRTYLPPEKVRDFLKEKASVVGYLAAALLGIVSPFCSCSTIPLFLGFVGAGVPFGMTITFLFVSPMVNEAATVVLFTALGWRIALTYIFGGIVIRIIPYVLLGVGVGAAIHGFVPQEFIAGYLKNPFGVPVATAIGVPIYTNIMGIIPVVESLIEKGLPVGTSIAFMMSVAALSLPEFVMLKRVMKKELIISYAALVGTGIIVLGSLFNLVF